MAKNVNEPIENLISQPDEILMPYLAKAVQFFGKYYNGYEVHGLEKIPTEGPALIVFYHGLMPLDLWYFGLTHYLEKHRLIRPLVDRFLFKVPILKRVLKTVGAVSGDYDTALGFLQQGDLVGVSPGGVREAIAGEENNYKLMWGERSGFAKLAIETRAPIIPAFTENVEELYKAPFAGHPFFQSLYEKTRLPLVPIMGLGALPFPVKLRTWIGDPIFTEANDTVESIREKTKLGVEALIAAHQKPGTTILSAVQENLKRS